MIAELFIRAVVFAWLWVPIAAVALVLFGWIVS